MIGKYVKRPVVIEAVQWTGDNADEVKKFVGIDAEYLEDKNAIVIHTLEGHMVANVKDFIIKGVKGEFYPCQYDIFCETYEAVAMNPNF